MQLYIVMGRTGGDDLFDRGRAWMVAAYTDRDAAAGHAKAAQAHAAKVHRDDPFNWRDHPNPHDPNMEMDTLTGTHYATHVVPLLGHTSVAVLADMKGGR